MCYTPGGDIHRTTRTGSVSDKKTITICKQLDATADVLIDQLMQFKTDVARLQKTLAGVSTPALGNGRPTLADEHITRVLNNRDRTIKKRSK